MNSQLERQTTRAASQMTTTGFIGKDGTKDNLMQQDAEINENHHIKSTFKPIDQSQSGQATDRQDNLSPVKVSDTVHEINLRSTVAMDNEPQHFLQVFQGSIVVTTDDYLRRQ